MSLMVWRMMWGKSVLAVVVISPATIAKPVLTRVSQATRAFLSWVRMASRMESEIWSAILSGWPSVTDSEENKYLELLMKSPLSREAAKPNHARRICINGFNSRPNLFKFKDLSRRLQGVFLKVFA